MFKNNQISLFIVCCFLVGIPVKFVFSASARADQTAYAGVVETCPFKSAADQSVTDLVDSVKSSLNQLAKDCPQLSERVRQAEQKLISVNVNQKERNSDNSGYYSNMQSPNPSLDGLTLNCRNYKTLLTREQEIAISRIGVTSLPSRYYSCANRDDPAQCINKIFMQSMSESSANCKATLNDKLDEEMTKKIFAAADSFSDLVRESNSCPVTQRTPQLLLNTSSGFLDVLAGVSMNFGLAGALSGFLAKTVGSLLDSQALSDSPKLAIYQLENESNFENIACIWYQLQNRNLRCQEYQVEAVNAQTNRRAVTCPEYLNNTFAGGNNLLSLKSLMQNLNSIEKNSEENSAESLDEIVDLMKKKIPHPIEGPGKAITVENHMAEISEVLAASNLQKDRSQAEKLNRVMHLTKKLVATHQDQTLVSSKKSAELDKIRKEFQTDIKKFNFNEAVDRYWVLKGQTAPSVLLSIESSLAGNKAILNMSQGIDTNIPKIQLTSNFMVKNFNIMFEKRLELVRRRYDAALKDGDTQAVKSHALQLMNLCSMASGMFLSSVDGDDIQVYNALRRINLDKGKYNKACSAISCLDKPKKVLFSSDKKGKELADDFRKHQCQTLLDYDIIVEDLNRRLTATGAICK